MNNFVYKKHWAEQMPFMAQDELPEGVGIREFKSSEPGETILILGAIHGNETAGPNSIAEIIQKLDSQELSLQKGRVVFIPVCNPRAYIEGERFIDKNLNRVINPAALQDDGFYEHPYAKMVIEAIERADVLLDIHSTLKPAEPFSITVGDKDTTVAMHTAIGCQQNITDLADPYEPDYTTVRYAAELGKDAVLIETGSHADPNTALVAEKAILNTLAQKGMIDHKVDPISQERNPDLTIIDVFFNDKVKGYVGTDCPPAFKTYKKGEPIAEMNEGTIIYAPVDGTTILFPNKGKKENPPQASGAEQFYISVPTSLFNPELRHDLQTKPEEIVI